MNENLCLINAINAPQSQVNTEMDESAFFPRPDLASGPLRMESLPWCCPSPWISSGFLPPGFGNGIVLDCPSFPFLFHAALIWKVLYYLSWVHTGLPCGSDKSLHCYCCGHWFNPKEGKKGRLPFTNQERPQKKISLPTPSSWTSSLQTCGEIDFCYLRHSVCGIWSGQP